MNNVNQEYHNYLKTVLSHEKSVYKTSRAGSTIGISGAMMQFDLSKNFPIINTKRVHYNGVVHETGWFVRGPEADGNMHIDYLINNGANFWTRDLHNFNNNKKGIKFTDPLEREADFEKFQEKILNDLDFRKEMGSLGRPYGAQWRDWIGADGSHTDQLANAFTQIKNHSDSRRLIVESWKVDEINNMALPPCHKEFQFLVMNDRLDIMMTQRSADSFLGVPTNIMHYALMGNLGAAYAGLEPGVFTHHLNDAHIYCGYGKKAEWYKNNLNELKNKVKNAETSEDYLTIKKWIDTNSDKEENIEYERFDHVTAVLTQLSRDVNKYPIANLEVIIDKNKTPKELLDTISFDNFKITGYEENYYPGIIRRMPTG
ncbi:MAG: thymidylate synthase [Candidatus Woesearchaeota archaeon]